MYLGWELGWVLVCKSNGCVSLFSFCFSVIEVVETNA